MSQHNGATCLDFALSTSTSAPTASLQEITQATPQSSFCFGAELVLGFLELTTSLYACRNPQAESIRVESKIWTDSLLSSCMLKISATLFVGTARLTTGMSGGRFTVWYNALYDM